MVSVAPTKLLSGMGTGPVAETRVAAPPPPVWSSKERLKGPLGVESESVSSIGLPTCRGSGLLDKRKGSALAPVPPPGGMTG
jgi:hypothetical protein